MKHVFALLIVLVTGVAALAQEKRFNLYGSYIFDDRFENYTSSNDYYQGKIMGGFQWGAGFEFKPQDEVGIELLYYRQDTQAPVEFYNVGPVSRSFDLGVNYILIGGTRYVPKDKIEGFGGILLGATIFNNKNPSVGEESSNVRFAVGARLGVNIWASDRVAIKLQALFLSSVQGFGGGFYFGTGGAGAGVSTYSTITQFGLGGGLSFRMGQ